MDLNTSHVNVNRTQKETIYTPETNLNTSHVNVNPIIKTKSVRHIAFKYISC